MPFEVFIVIDLTDSFADVTLADGLSRRHSAFMFTWIPLYRQIAHKVLEFEHREDELTALLHDFASRGLLVGSLEDEDAQGRRFPLSEIDPFTFFAAFNWQAHKVENRRAILAALRETWQLETPVPDDFEGIPLGNRQNLWLFSYQKQREAGDTPRLWQLARQVIDGTRANVDQALFSRALSQRNVGEVNLTVGMFWLKPHEFLPGDKYTRGYMERRGVPEDVWNGAAYFRWLEACVEKAGTNFPELARAAFVEKQPPVKYAKEEGEEKDESESSAGPKFWLMQAGRNGEAWENFKATSEIAVSFEGVEDFSTFTDKAAIREYIREMWPDEVLSAWQFCSAMNLGDIAFVYGGPNELRGVARITGDSRLEAVAPVYRYRRPVEWLALGPWRVREQLRCPAKILTCANNLDQNRARLRIANVELEGTAEAGDDVGTASSNAMAEAQMEPNESEFAAIASVIGELRSVHELRRGAIHAVAAGYDRRQFRSEEVAWDSVRSLRATSAHGDVRRS